MALICGARGTVSLTSKDDGSGTPTSFSLKQFIVVKGHYHFQDNESDFQFVANWN